MLDLDYLRIIKWILIIPAGFIGQFGKSFAKHLMERSRLKRNERATTIDITTSATNQNHPDKSHGAVESSSVDILPERKPSRIKNWQRPLAKQKRKRQRPSKKSDS